MKETRWRVSNKGKHAKIIEASSPYWAAQAWHSQTYGPGSGGPIETPRFSKRYTDHFGNPLTIEKAD